MLERAPGPLQRAYSSLCSCASLCDPRNVRPIKRAFHEKGTGSTSDGPRSLDDATLQQHACKAIAMLARKTDDNEVRFEGSQVVAHGNSERPVCRRHCVAA